MAILITTSRRTNQRTRRFAKELSWVIPFSLKINRGHMGLDDLRDLMYRKGFSRLLIVYSRRGNPYKILFLTPEIKSFNILMELEIKSLILQLDKGVRFVVSELEIVYEEGDREIYEILNEFIGNHIYDPTRIDGVYARMIISTTDNGYTVLRIIDRGKRELYPRLIVKRIERDV